MDVRMFHTELGGEITIEAGVVEFHDGLETAVYLSLFGGEELDSGRPDSASKQWWGNLVEDEPSSTYRSETQALLSTLPITTDSARRIEAAASRDLSWLVSDGYAQSVSASVTLPARNRIDLSIRVLADGRERLFTFEEKRL